MGALSDQDEFYLLIDPEWSKFRMLTVKKHPVSTGCAVQAEAHLKMEADGEQYRLRDAEQRVSLCL